LTKSPNWCLHCDHCASWSLVFVCFVPAQGIDRPSRSWCCNPPDRCTLAKLLNTPIYSNAFRELISCASYSNLKNENMCRMPNFLVPVEWLPSHETSKLHVELYFWLDALESLSELSWHSSKEPPLISYLLYNILVWYCMVWLYI
jgi:hypothetical protein